MVNIRKNLAASSMYSTKCPYPMTKPTSITVHNTANDAAAENEIKYMISNSNKVSFHYAVDDKEIVQGIADNRNAWHCGNTTGNRNSLSVEICYSKSGGDKFTKAEQNAAEFIASKLKEYGLKTTNVTTHKAWNGKDCPHRTLSLGWDRFIKMIQQYYDGTSGSTSSSGSSSGSGTASSGSSSTTSGTSYPLLKKGAKGDYVKEMQTRLVNLGYSVGSSGIDGNFGANTLVALKAFQSNNNLDVDGACGPKTWAKLTSNSAVKASASASSSYSAGKTYTVTAASGVNVRKTASTSGTKTGALPKGTKVTAADVVVSGKYIWLKYSGGYVCAVEGSSTYIK